MIPLKVSIVFMLLYLLSFDNNSGLCATRTLLETANQDCRDLIDNPYSSRGIYPTKENCIAHKYGKLFMKERIQLLRSESVNKEVVACKQGVVLKDLVICFNDDVSAAKPEVCRQVEECVYQITAERLASGDGCTRYFSDNDGSYLFLFSGCIDAASEVLQNSVYDVARFQFIKNSSQAERLERFKFNFLNKRLFFLPRRGARSYGNSDVSIMDMVKHSWFFLIIFLIAVAVIIVKRKDLNK